MLTFAWKTDEFGWITPYLSYCSPTQSCPVTVGQCCCSKSAKRTDDSELTDSQDIARFISPSLRFKVVWGDWFDWWLHECWIDWRVNVRSSEYEWGFFAVEYCSRWVSDTVLCKFCALNGFVADCSSKMSLFNKLDPVSDNDRLWIWLLDALLVWCNRVELSSAVTTSSTFNSIKVSDVSVCTK